MKSFYIVLIFIFAVLLPQLACSKMDEELFMVNHGLVTEAFLFNWEKQDWKEMYKYVHPNIIKFIRNKKLTEKQSKMSDEELFINEFESVAKENPDKRLRSYAVHEKPDYNRGDSVMWLHTEINGKNKKIPLTLDGFSLKVDITKMK